MADDTDWRCRVRLSKECAGNLPQGPVCKSCEKEATDVQKDYAKFEHNKEIIHRQGRVGNVNEFRSAQRFCRIAFVVSSCVPVAS